MKILITLSIIIGAATATWFGLHNDLTADTEKLELSGTVVDVLDGDTVKVTIDGIIRRVELAGIDSPEEGQPFGNAAKYFLSDTVNGRSVTLTNVSTNDYGDLVAEIILTTFSVNGMMLTNGYAWAERDRGRNSHKKGLETLARNKSLGLWRDTNATSPWDYREMLSNS